MVNLSVCFLLEVFFLTGCGREGPRQATAQTYYAMWLAARSRASQAAGRAHGPSVRKASRRTGIATSGQCSQEVWWCMLDADTARIHFSFSFMASSAVPSAVPKKRSRWDQQSEASSTATETGTTGQLIEHAAASVALRGNEYELVLRGQAASDPRYAFLTQPDTAEYRLYQQRLQLLRAAQQPASAPSEPQQLPVVAMPQSQPEQGRMVMAQGGVGRVFYPPKVTEERRQRDRDRDRDRDRRDRDRDRDRRDRDRDRDRRSFTEDEERRPRKRRGFTEEGEMDSANATEAAPPTSMPPPPPRPAAPGVQPEPPQPVD